MDAVRPPPTVYAVATPYAWEVVETLWRLGLDPVCVDNHGGADARLPGLSTHLAGTGAIVLGTSSPTARSTAASLSGVTDAARFLPVVDPTAALARTAHLGHGTYVNALVSVGAHAQLGCFVNLNRAASVGHHCVLGAFTCTGPSATLCGAVITGVGVFLGAGSVVLPERRIGAHATVGAGAVVTRDIPAGAVVVGNPARIVGENALPSDPLRCPLC